MIAIDDSFVEGVGLGELSKTARGEFCRWCYAKLEMDVGEKLTEGMSDESLDVFGYFVDKDLPKMRTWYSWCLADFESSKEFLEFKQALPGADEATLLSEYGAMKWLQFNRPDYPEIVEKVFENLKQVILENPQRFVDAFNGDTAEE